MKSFARLFFAVGAALTAHLFLFPATLKLVCIPASPAPMAISAEHSTQKTSAPIIETVELVVNGVPYKFQLTSLEVEHVHSLAKEFCLSHHAAESSSAEQLEAGCTQVVVNNIFFKIKESRAAAAPAPPASASAVADSAPAQANTQDAPASTIYQVNVPVTNGKTYSISFDAAVHGPYQVSDHFCRENAAELMLESETQITQGCVPSVGKYIADQLESVGFASPAASASAQQPQTANP